MIFWSFGPEVLDMIAAVVGGAAARKVTWGARVPIPVLLVNFNLSSQSLKVGKRDNLFYNLYQIKKEKQAIKDWKEAHKMIRRFIQNSQCLYETR